MDMSQAPEIIQRVLPWMQKYGIKELRVTFEGAGDEGHFDEVTLIKRDGEEVAAEIIKEYEDEFGYDIESLIFDRTPWDCINGSGGVAYLTLRDDGRYKIEGGWYGDLTEADPVYGTFTDMPPDEGRPRNKKAEISHEALGRAVQALDRAERFMAGFEDDSSQGGVRESLAIIRESLEELGRLPLTS